MNATPAMSKKIRDLARDAYENGELRRSYEDDHNNGSYRSVTIEDGVAIKFARHDGFTAHNRAEWDAWRKFPASVQAISAKPFCISACGRVMAVESVPETLHDAFCKGEREAYHQDITEFNENLNTLLLKSGFSSKEIGALMVDNHAHNIGVRKNGDLCWIDYAGYADTE